MTIQIRRVTMALLAILAISFFFVIKPAFAKPSFPTTIIDAAGNEVFLKTQPRRIAVIGRTFFAPLHMVYMFKEGAEALVGFERRGGGESEFLPIIDSDSESLIELKPEPGPEQVMSMRPDLVITKGNTKGPLYRSMASLGIPVLHVGLEYPEQFLEDIKNLGQALGAPERARDIISFYQKRMDLIEKRVSAIPEDKKPGVLVVRYDQRSGTASVQAPAKSWIQTIQVEKSGGNPVWLSELSVTNNWSIIGFEQIANWNPDKIIMVIWFKLHGPTVLDKLRNDSKWGLLKAVRANEFYHYPEDIYGWDTPDPRWILGLQWMAKTTHPVLFEDVDIHNEVTRFFHEMFFIDESVIKEKLLPLIVLKPTPN